MKPNYIILPVLSLVLIWIINSCTKVDKGFLSPTVQYAVNEFSVIRGRTSKSYSLVTDGSSIPMKVKWVHIYDSTGKIVDDLFSKTYPVDIWTKAYDANTDKTFAAINAKQTTIQMPPIIVNESNGIIETNYATMYLPVGTYFMDLEITNIAGTQILPKIMKINIVDGKTVEISPETGSFSNSLLYAGTATGKGTLFNGPNNPFVDYTLTRFADTPNVFVLKVMDRNGVPFNPKTGEFVKRPNSGLNPNPPYLQNLEDYAPDTYTTSDTAISIKFPLVPFPMQSLGNGYNMYYRIPTAYVTIDSTTSWPSNSAGNFYKGTSDTHYRGLYKNDLYDYALRIPMRIYVPGSYNLSIKILNTTHR